jgi:glyoxylase-like metal-dependent hydrolase (beta-lactamase superfamily II)
MGVGLRRLSEHLFVFEDTCNVYLVKDGEAGLLIDAGSGAVAEVAGEVGVTSLEWVLHTHHHRDQCWGTPRIVAEHGSRVAVPEHERYLFASAREHWQTKRIFDNYTDRNTFFAPGEDIAVDAVLEDYEEFCWRGLRFFVLPAKGHTFGSSALLAEIDGRLVAFTGDLLAAGGLLYQLHAMEYGYGDMIGVLFTLQSLHALRRRKPDLVLPSHGAPIESVEEDIDRLQQRLIDLVRLEGLQVFGAWPWAPDIDALPEPRFIRLSEHLLASGPWACSNFYVLLSGSGEALLIDYGHAFGAHLHVGSDQLPFEQMRFVAHHLDELQEHFGVHSIEVVVPTHIHDDHTCGIPYLQRHHGTACWALDEVAKVLEAPAEWTSTPCTFPEPIRVERTLTDGERIVWRGVELTFHHAPGQTEFHSVISAEIDGNRVAFTGDNALAISEIDGTAIPIADTSALEGLTIGEVGQRLYQTTVFRNSFQLAMHRRCVEVMRAIEPELICPGHGDVLACTQQTLDQYADHVARKERAFRAVVAEPADHHVDLFWARLRPYLASATPGGQVEYTLMLRNNLDRPATYAARLIAPPGWTTPSEPETVKLDAGESSELTLTITTPTHANHGRTLLTAEVLIDGHSHGPLAEALISLHRAGEA